MNHLIFILDTAKRFRRLSLALTALALLCGAQGAWASCVRNPGAETKFVPIDMGKILIPPDLPVGATIAARNVSVPVNGLVEVQIICPNGGALNFALLKGSAIANGSKIYSTDVVGVGIRISGNSTSSSPLLPPNPFPRVMQFESGSKIGVHYQDAISVELFKTAAVTGSGPLAAGTYSQVIADGDGFSMVTTTMSGNGTTIVSSSCAVDLGSRNIPVALGKVTTTPFKGQGSTAGDRNFNIKLNCSTAQNAQYTVLMRMDAQADPSNAPGVLRLTQAGATIAGGVGIQVVDANAKTPVKFGEATVVGPLNQGSYVLPYTARYYQTGAKVTPGQANGTATFTLSYK